MFLLKSKDKSRFRNKGIKQMLQQPIEREERQEIGDKGRGPQRQRKRSEERGWYRRGGERGQSDY